MADAGRRCRQGRRASQVGAVGAGTVRAMSPIEGPYLASVVVLGVAGILKVAAPASTRVALRSAGLPGTPWVARGLGIGEVGLAGVALALGGWPAALAVGVVHVGFAWFSTRLISLGRGRASCGCFGGSDAPVSRLHVVVNLAVAAGAFVVAVTSPEGLVDAVRTVADDAGTGAAVGFLVGVAVLARLLVALLTDLPALQAAARGRGARSVTA